MTSGRHRQTHERRNFKVPAAVLSAPAITLGAVGVGMSGTASAPATSGAISASAMTTHHATPGATHRATAAPGLSQVDSDRTARLNRSLTISRAKLSVAPAKVAVLKPVVRFTTDTLNLRATPAKDARVLGEVAVGSRLKATGLFEGAYAQVLWKGERHWVTAAYLSQERPATPVTMGLSSAPCPDGSVENGLTAAAVKVYRAVCHNFPQVTSYGGYDNHGEHSSGRAIDIMISDVQGGTAIAEFLKAHASELGLFDVIWRQHIWTPVRAGEGWRSMSDRGSATANHYDHVHVSVN